MIFKESLPAEMANQLFNDNEKALKFIADAKWEDGFVCRKCANTNFCEGKEFSSYDYSDKLELNQMTCWKFRKRIKECVMKTKSLNTKVAIKTILLSKY